MTFSPSLILPLTSIFSLYLYFLTYDIFLNPTLKVFRDFVFLILVSLHFLYLLLEKQKGNPGGNFTIAGSTILSFLFFVIRSYLEVPVRAGVVQEATYIPKLRDFFLFLIILSALYSLVYQILEILSRRSIHAQSRLSESKRSLLKETAYNFLLLLPILVAVNYFAVAKNYNFDLSSIGKFSYSEPSRAIIKQLDRKVTVTAFYPRPLEASGKEESWALSAVRMELAIYLEQLSAINPRIEVRFINADVERDLLGEFDQVSNGMIVFRTLQAGAPSGGSPYAEEKILVQNKKDLEDLERKIVQALNNLTVPSKTIYFTSANGEHYGENYNKIPDGKLNKLISQLSFFNYKIKELGFREGWPGTIPEDADMIAIIGPEVEFTEDARTAILAYILEKKGKLFITINPRGKEKFSWLLEKSSLSFENGSLRQVQGRPEIVATGLPEHPITSLFIKKEIGVVFPFSGYFERKPGGNQQFTETIILESGFNTFLDTNENGAMDGSEKQSNFLLGVTLIPMGEKQEGESGKILIFSGTEWLTDRYFLFNLNPGFAGNSINYLHQKQILDSIVSKREETPIITLTQNQKLFIWSVGLFGYPLSLVLGLSYYVYSRRKSTP